MASPEDDDRLLLDIRPSTAFEEWHLPNSENIDVYEVLTENPQAATEEFADLPTDREIVTVCTVGAVSATATEVLREMGYDAKTLEDGLQGWSRVHTARPLSVDLPGRVIQVARPGTGCLSYVLIADGEAAIVDPSLYIGEYEALLEDQDATLGAVLETHAHADHVSGAGALADAYDVPHYLHPADAGALDSTQGLADGDEFTVGPLTLQVEHTPGHTPGSVTFTVQDVVLLTGDTLFLDSVGRPDLEGGSDDEVHRRAGTLFDSLQRLLAHPADSLVAPAHHAGTPDPPTTATLETVRDRNELLGRGQEAFTEAVLANVPETPPNHQRIKRVNVGEASVDPDEARQLELGPNRCAAE